MDGCIKWCYIFYLWNLILISCPMHAVTIQLYFIKLDDTFTLLGIFYYQQRMQFPLNHTHMIPKKELEEEWNGTTGINETVDDFVIRPKIRFGSCISSLIDKH